MSGKEGKKKFSVVFVCSGNTCRSPMAVGLLVDLLASRELSHLVSVSSAGLMAAVGVPASTEAVTVCAEKSIDISGHKSRLLSDNIIREADLLLVMQKTHLAMVSHSRETAGKDVRLLGEFHPDSGGIRDILDPYGCGLEIYRTIFDNIRDCMDALIDYLLEKSEKKQS